MMANEVKKYLDPVVRILAQRTVSMRREIAKKGELRGRISKIVARYNSWKQAGGQREGGGNPRGAFFFGTILVFLGREIMAPTAFST